MLGLVAEVTFFQIGPFLDVVVKSLFFGLLFYTREWSEQLKTIDLVKELKWQNTFQSQFLRFVYHEIRNPFNSIMLGLDFLQNELMIPEHISILSMLRTCANSLKQVVDDAVELTSNQGTLELIIEPVNVAKLIQNAIDEFKMLAESKGVSLFLDLAPNMPNLVYGDKSKLKKMFQILLSNGVKFSPHGKTVKVMLEVEDFVPPNLVSFVFSVIDNGAGIREEVLPLLFQPFALVRPGDFSEDKDRGTGLSLCLLQHIANLMSSKISVSTKIGEGSVFKIFLTLEQSPETEGRQCQSRSSTSDVLHMVARRLTLSDGISLFPKKGRAKTHESTNASKVHCLGPSKNVFEDFHPVAGHSSVPNSSRAVSKSPPDFQLRAEVLNISDTIITRERNMHASPSPVHSKRTLSSNSDSPPITGQFVLNSNHQPVPSTEQDCVLLQEVLKNSHTQVMYNFQPFTDEREKVLEQTSCAGISLQKHQHHFTDSRWKDYCKDENMQFSLSSSCSKLCSSNYSQMSLDDAKFAARHVHVSHDSGVFIVPLSAARLERGKDVLFDSLCSQIQGKSLCESGNPCHLTNSGSELSLEDQHILIVDDVRSNVKMMDMILSKLGFRCDVAFNGQEAVALARLKHYNLILMDNVMPVMNGIEATRTILSFDAATTIVGVTGNVLQHDKDEFLKAGAKLVLEKPIDRAKLITVTIDFAKAWVPQQRKKLEASLGHV